MITYDIIKIMERMKREREQASLDDFEVEK